MADETLEVIVGAENIATEKPIQRIYDKFLAYYAYMKSLLSGNMYTRSKPTYDGGHIDHLIKYPADSPLARGDRKF
jgi:hypothetical protein